jgi:hypothetical protein
MLLGEQTSVYDQPEDRRGAICQEQVGDVSEPIARFHGNDRLADDLADALHESLLSKQYRRPIKDGLSEFLSQARVIHLQGLGHPGSAHRIWLRP